MDNPTASPTPDTPERFGPWIVERKIGSGGMGTVYLARHTETGREAAVKVLPASLSREEGFVARFQREIESLKKLKNPHVVELYDDGIEQETLYYAMEYVPGTTINDHIRENGKLKWREVIDIGVQVCSALKAAHDAGVIHRDLKPSNLILRDDGVVKLTDFGVAQVFAGTRLTKTGGVIGTVEYMSPEQAKGGRVTRKSDLYSLGAVMYAMLTGRPPFTGKTSLEVVQKHQYGRFDRPMLYAPEMPHWLDDLVCQLLEKEPDNRYPDAYVLSRRLQEIVRKVQLSLEDETVAAEERRQSDEGETVPAVSERARQGPGISTIMRDAVRRELVSTMQPGWIGRLFNNIWFLLALLVLLILGGVWWYRARDLTPQERFEAGVELMEQPAGDGWITARDEHFQPLIDEDAERWKPKIKPYLRKIRVYELEQELTSGKRRGKLNPPQTDPERFLVLAVQLRDSGDFQQAEQILEALETLTAGRPDRAAIHDLTQKLLRELRQQRAEQFRESTLIDEAFETAETHLKNNRPAKARAVWRSVIVLYGNHPAAKDAVRRARRLLEEHTPEPAPETKQ